MKSVKFKYFTRSEFDCQETGENKIPDAFIRRLDRLRGRCGFPFVVVSGYRSQQHSIEAAKDSPGEHTRAAADIRVANASQRYVLVREALDMEFAGLGVAASYVHLDDRAIPAMWTY